MLLGYPYKFAFLLEHIPEWDDGSFIQGMMFLMINEKIYPNEPWTATFSTELPMLLDEKYSPMKNPVVNKELYSVEGRELYDRLMVITHSEELDALYDSSYYLPFMEINDLGWEVFVISDGEKVRLLVGKWNDSKSIDGRQYREKPEFLDEVELTCEEYNSVIDKLEDFYNSLYNERRS